MDRHLLRVTFDPHCCKLWQDFLDGKLRWSEFIRYRIGSQLTTRDISKTANILQATFQIWFSWKERFVFGFQFPYSLIYNIWSAWEGLAHNDHVIPACIIFSFPVANMGVFVTIPVGILWMTSMYTLILWFYGIIWMLLRYIVMVKMDFCSSHALKKTFKFLFMWGAVCISCKYLHIVKKTILSVQVPFKIV